MLPPLALGLLLALHAAAPWAPWDGGGPSYGRILGVCEGECDSVPKGSVTAMLLGALIFMMAMVYLVHWPNEHIRLVTWQLVSTTTSIFVAVMINTVLVRVLHRFPISMPWQVGSLTGLFWFVPLLILVQLSIYLHEGIASTARATIGGHILGFTGTHIFGQLQEGPLFSGTPWTAVLVLPTFALIWSVVSCVTKRLRGEVERLESESEDESEIGIRNAKCEDCEDDFACIVLSFLASQVIRFAICGQLPPVDGTTVEHSLWQDHILGATGLLFLFAVFGLAKFLTQYSVRASMERAVSILQGTMAKLMSWCWIFWGRWHLWESLEMDELLAKVSLAGITSVITMIMIFLLTYLADKEHLDPGALRKVVEALGLMIGSSWEACFDATVEDLNTKLQPFVAVGLALFTLPGWRLYILPRAQKAWEVKHSENPPSLASLCTKEQKETDDEEDEGLEEAASPAKSKRALHLG